MFVDSVSIFIASGHGGAGAVSFRREKFVIQGGPDGGDGGRGGDVYFVVDKNTTTLAKFRGHKKYVASNGMPGEGKNCNGKKGKDIIIKVLPGTQVINQENNEVLLDLLEDGQKVKFLVGGKGGLGNTHFKNASNQRPTYAQKGLPGVSMQVQLELKLIADVALVGFPNVGKSSLIATITNAQPKIANYAFTTLIPNLGVVDVDMLHSFVIADIPGLIQGASSGKGLGLQFLQHIERTKVLLFMLDASWFAMDIPVEYENSTQDSDFHAFYEEINAQDPAHKALLQQFFILYHELLHYSPLLASRPYAIAFTKSDVALHEDFCAFEFRSHKHLQLQTKAYIAQPLLDFMNEGTPIILPNATQDSKQNINQKQHCTPKTHSKPHLYKDSQSMDSGILDSDSQGVGSFISDLDSQNTSSSALDLDSQSMGLGASDSQDMDSDIPNSKPCNTNSLTSDSQGVNLSTSDSQSIKSSRLDLDSQNINLSTSDSQNTASSATNLHNHIPQSSATTQINMPLFILPISTATTCNLKALQSLLFFALQGIENAK